MFPVVQTGAVDQNEASSCRLQQQCNIYQVQHNLHHWFSPVRHTGDRSLWWSSVCRADRLWAPCASRSAWRGNTAGPAPGSASPSPEEPPPGGARRISTRQDSKEEKKNKTSSSSSSGWWTFYSQDGCFLFFWFLFQPTLMSKVAWGVKSAKERETTTLEPWWPNTHTHLMLVIQKTHTAHNHWQIMNRKDTSPPHWQLLHSRPRAELDHYRKSVT